jgi:hypothetical protein
MINVKDLPEAVLNLPLKKNVAPQQFPELVKLKDQAIK